MSATATGVATTDGRRPRTALWTVVSAVVGAVIAATAWISPLVPLAIVGSLLVIALAAFRPKAFAAIGMVLIALAVPLGTIVGSVGSHADEAVVAISLIAFTTRRFVTTGTIRWLPGGSFFLIYLAFAVASSIVHGVGVQNMALTAYLAVKGVLYAFALAQLSWTRRDLVVLLRFGVGTILVVVATAVVNLLVPDTWAHLTTGHGVLHYVGGLPALNGPFQHPAALSRFCAILAIGALAYAFVVRTTIGTIVLIALTGTVAVLTFETKSMVGLVVMAVVLLVLFARARGWVTFLSLAPVAVVLVAAPLGYLVGRDVASYITEASARGRLTTGAIDLANQYFPFGAGLSRWGSSTAATDYSPEYAVRGFPHIFGLGPGTNGQFLNDTQWPAIIGESGWIGGAAFALGMLCLLIALLRRTAVVEDPLVFWLRVAGIGWMIALTIESSVAPVFVSTPSYPFVFAAAGVISAIRKDGLLPARVPVVQARDSAQSASISGYPASAE